VYVLTYSVSDTSDNSASTSRTVVVKPESCQMAYSLAISSATAVPGSEVTLTVSEDAGSCSAGDLNYTWLKAPLLTKADFVAIPEAPNAPEFVITDIDFSDAGVYKCTITDAADSFDTNEVTLTVGSGVPVAGAFGVLFAAAAAALAGAVSVRKRR